MSQRKWYRNFLMKGFHLVVVLTAGPGIRDTQVFLLQFLFLLFFIFYFLLFFIFDVQSTTTVEVQYFIYAVNEACVIILGKIHLIVYPDVVSSLHHSVGLRCLLGLLQGSFSQIFV